MMMRKKEKSGCLKKLVIMLLITGGVLAPAALAAIYLTATSSAFLKSVVLPRAGQALGAKISADEISVSLLKSEVRLKNLNVENDSGKIVAVQSLDAVFSLRAYLFSNTVSVKKFSLENAELVLSRGEDGKWNIPGAEDSPKKAAEEKNTSKTALPKFDINNVEIKNLNLRMSSKHPGEPPFSLALENFGLRLPALRNGAECSMSLGGKISMSSGEDINLREGEIFGKADLYLSDELLPEMGHALLELKNLKGIIEGVDIGGRSLALTFDGKKENGAYVVESLSIKESSGEEDTQSAAGMKGAVSPGSGDFEFFVDIAKISPQMLRILEEFAGGVHLGPASVKYRGHAKRSGETLGLDGSLRVTNIHLRRQDARRPAIPPLDLAAEHDLSIDLKERKLDVKSLSVDLSNKGTKDKLAAIDAPKPFSLKWGGEGSPNEGNPELSIKISKLDLGILKAFMPQSPDFAVNGGIADMRILAEYDLRQNLMKIDGDTVLSDMSFMAGGSNFEKVSVRKKFSVGLKDFRNLTLKPFVVEIEKNSIKACSITLEAAYDIDTFKGTFRAAVGNIDNNSLTLLPTKPENAAATKDALAKIPPFTMLTKAAAKFDVKEKVLEADYFNTEFKTRGKKTLSVELAKPLRLSWAQKIDPLAMPFSLTIGLNSFELVCLNSLLFNTPGLHVADGKATALVAVEHLAGGNALTFNTDLSVSDLQYSSGGEAFGPFGVKHKSAFKIEDGRILKSASASTEILANGKSAAKMSNSLEADFATGMLDSSNRLDSLNQNILALLPAETRKSIALKSAEVKGKVGFKRKKEGEFALTSDLVLNGILAKTQAPLDGRLAANAECRAGVIELKRAELSMLENDNVVADLTLRGRVAHPIRTGKSTLEIKSSKIDISTIQDIFMKKGDGKTPQKPPQKPTPPADGSAEEAEPAPTDLGGLDLDADIDLKNILYGKDIKAAYKGKLLVKNGAVTLDPLLLTLNGTQTKFSLFMDMNKKDGYPFMAKGGFAGLQLPPLIRAFEKGVYSETKGEISDFALDVKGKGFTTRNLSAHLNGTLKTDFKDLSIPNQMRDNKYVCLLLLPVEVFNQVKGYIPNINFPDKLQKALNKTKSFFDMQSNINFHDGAVRLSASNGAVRIEKCLFEGDFITSLSMSGQVGFDKSLDISSNLDASGIIVPLDIGGTLDAPKPDIKKFIPIFIQENALNVLLNTDLKSLIEKPKESLEQILTGGSDGSSQKSSKKTGDKNSGEATELLDGLLKGVLGGGKKQNKR